MAQPTTARPRVWPHLQPPPCWTLPRIARCPPAGSHSQSIGIVVPRVRRQRVPISTREGAIAQREPLHHFGGGACLDQELVPRT